MFFNKAEEIWQIAARNGVAVFVMPEKSKFEVRQAIVLKPEDKSVITIEQVRSVISKLNMKQVTEQYVVVRPADALNLEAANALLKSLEEPGDKVHFILVTAAISKILPTVLSRSAVYILRSKVELDGGIDTNERVKALAKRLMAARVGDLVPLAEEITRKKDGVRAYALEVLGVAIEMLYKSYFITGKMIFVQKLPKFLRAYEGIAQNGHIKLHLVADLC